MGRKRCILHINIIGFAHAVAALHDPSLQDRPVVVAPPINRSQIFDLSPHASACGIRKGMALTHAIRLCPDCLITPPRFDLYRKAMTALRHEIRPFSPFIEHGLADGHLFTDISGTSRLFGPGADVAQRICTAVTTRIGLTPGWAIGANKLVTKVASRVSRAHGECEVTLGKEAIFLAPHTLTILPGTHHKELQYLDDFCINSMGDTVKLNMSQLQVLLGRRAPFYHDSCRGIDTIPVGEHGQKKNITALFTLPEDTNDEQKIRAVLTFLGTAMGFKLRKQDLVIKQLNLGIEYTDTTRINRTITLATRTNIDGEIITPVQEALQRVWRKRIRVRSLYLNADHFGSSGQQLSLFSTDHRTILRQQKLITALDSISSQFGLQKIQRGRTLQIASPLSISSF